MKSFLEVKRLKGAHGLQTADKQDLTMLCKMHNISQIFHQFTWTCHTTPERKKMHQSAFLNWLLSRNFVCQSSFFCVIPFICLFDSLPSLHFRELILVYFTVRYSNIDRWGAILLIGQQNMQKYRKKPVTNVSIVLYFL